MIIDIIITIIINAEGANEPLWQSTEVSAQFNWIFHHNSVSINLWKFELWVEINFLLGMAGCSSLN